MKKNKTDLPVSAIVIGAGSRGRIYADYALNNPHKLKIAGVAEPEAARRKLFAKEHNLSETQCFPDWQSILSRKKMADAAFICTQDNMHVEPAIAAMNQGYNLLLEKPVATSPEGCLQMLKEYQKHSISIAVGHVLRYTGFFHRIKQLIDNGEIGRITGIQHNENIGHIHYSHSYVRGNWRREELASPILLAKSCHDMDILLYLTNARQVKISSFGNRSVFTEANKPKGTPRRCLDGCPLDSVCPYFAPRIYMTGSTDWPVDTITTDLTPKGIKEALLSGPYGRCVYSCDNDVMEQQTVNMLFDNSIPAVFSMSAFTESTCRTLKVVGEKGQINGHMEKNEIEIHNFSSNDVKTIHLENTSTLHGGGDTGIMQNFISHIANPAIPLRSSFEESIFSHIITFTAEKARKQNSVETVSIENL